MYSDVAFNNISTCYLISWSCANPEAARGGKGSSGDELEVLGLGSGGRFVGLCHHGPFHHPPGRAGEAPGDAGGGFTGCTAGGFKLGAWSVYSGESQLRQRSSKGVITPAAARPACVIFSSYPLR